MGEYMSKKTYQAVRADLRIVSRPFAQYVEEVREFHGYAAPGVVMGGIMVDLALGGMPEGVLFDAVSETKACLPDAIQLLTPCTVGNGWLKILNLGRWALSLYDKHTGAGRRVHLDARRLDPWPGIRTWFLNLAPKKEQDPAKLLQEIEQAGASLYVADDIRMKPRFMERKGKKRIVFCPLCGEAYPAGGGSICRACQGEAPYEPAESEESFAQRPRAVPVELAVGKRALHDMTRIVPGASKTALFRRGQTITAGDVCRLQRMGRNSVYVVEDAAPTDDWLHEDEAARALARAMAGEGVAPAGEPCEGKVNLVAAQDGLFLADAERLEAFNMIPDLMCACRHGHSVVEKGMQVAGTRAIPLYLARQRFEQAMSLLAEGPLFRVAALRPVPVGILVTGSEVFQGLVEDKFVPVISSKVFKYGCPVVASRIVPDERAAIVEGLRELLAAGAGLVVTTGGLSVDPEDVTRQALAEAGMTDMLYGAPLLPGAMTLLGRLNGARVVGVPACALYFKTTSFDVLLPRVLAGLDIGRRDLAGLGHGALCLECKTCTYPKCPFGK